MVGQLRWVQPANNFEKKKKFNYGNYHVKTVGSINSEAQTKVRNLLKKKLRIDLRSLKVEYIKSFKYFRKIVVTFKIKIIN